MYETYSFFYKTHTRHSKALSQNRITRTIRAEISNDTEHQTVQSVEEIFKFKINA